MSIEASVPLPLEPPPPPEADEKRLWIGNIDSRLTEYNLLKIVQKFGEIKKFDFLFHKSGPLKGQPRGYSFVTYESRAQAERALESLNGTPALGKDLVVKWAHTAPSKSFITKKDDTPNAEKKIEEAKQTKDAIQQIMAIEAKLKAMNEQRDRELEMCMAAAPLAAENPLLLNKRTPPLLQQKPRSVPYNRHAKKQPGTRKR